MNKIKNKKTIIVLLILLVGIIGITIAYFSNSTTLDNLFSTKEYGTTYIEEFVSPDSWLPGDVTEKTIKATNSGSVDQAVRISYTEKWLTDSGIELNGWIHEDGTKSNHETEEEINSDERVAIINFDNNDDWTYNNGYYYYNYRLKPNESTSSLIKSVTFNSKTKLDDTCETTLNNGVKTITCNSSGDNYDGATYTLTFKIETVQYNKYNDAWNIDVAILNEQPLFCDAFEVGEVVDYNGSEYYVLKDSTTSDDYVTLLKKEPLTASEVNQYSIDYVSQDGEYPYYESDTCNENNQTGCSTNYDTSDVKKIVDGWSSSFSDDLVEIDGYKTRIINIDNFINDFHYKYIMITPSDIGYKTSDNTPSFVLLNSRYWTSYRYEDSDNTVYYAGNDRPNTTKIYDKLYIRPLIYLKKSAINGSCYNYKYKQYLTCEKGEEVTYNNDKYYVLEESGNTKKYVTLLKADTLTSNEINNISNNYISENGEYPFCLENNECRGNNWNYSLSKNNFDYYYSDVKKIVDSLFNDNIDDLVNISGYKARLLRIEEFDSTLASDTRTYWSMTTYGYQTYKDVEGVYGISSYLSEEEINEKLYIRPVINLKKNAIQNGCHMENNNNSNNIDESLDTNYIIGSYILYNNTNYCVINNSKKSDEYITVLKQDPLTYDEIVTYNNGYELGRDSIDNNIGTMSFYKSDTCYHNSENDKNTSDCNYDYNNSFIKNIVNNWSDSFNNDLKEVNGYKARLITKDELINMGHIYHSRTSSPVITKSIYNCLYIDSDYWSMSTSIDSSSVSDIVSKIDNNNGPQYIDKKYAVRPVINLKKCAITNTCE